MNNGNVFDILLLSKFSVNFLLYKYTEFLQCIILLLNYHFFEYKEDIGSRYFSINRY